MHIPTVSFVVPCYKLAHLLSECVDSILCQTFGDFEVLIMDDCSPDNTEEVARSFQDPRVTYVRNDENVGHLRNYNKGIGMSRGKYIWLISADDRLRTRDLLEHYVRVMEDKPSVGYACCPAFKLDRGIETEIEGRLVSKDTIFKGQEFLKILLKGNFVIAASGIVRRTCYETCGAFPLDLPYTGDWFLWCLFAIHFDVAYFADPMVNYRAHELSMTNYLMNHNSSRALKEGFSVLWRVRKHAQQVGANRVVQLCEASLARLYGHHLVGGAFQKRPYHLTEEELDVSLLRETTAAPVQDWIRARAWTTVGDSSFGRRDFAAAGAYYKRALRYDRSMLKIWIKRLLVDSGYFGALAVSMLSKIKSATAWR